MRLPERVAFDEPILGAKDGFGGRNREFQEQFSTRAGFVFLRSGEKVQAGRLAGSHTIAATIRRSSSSLRIRSDWQMRDRSSGEVYNVRSVEPNKKRPRLFLDVLCETAVK